jgi:hypothetical protein
MVGRILIAVCESGLIPGSDELEWVAHPLRGVGSDERLQIGGHRLQYIEGEDIDVFPEPGQVIVDEGIQYPVSLPAAGVRLSADPAGPRPAASLLTVTVSPVGARDRRQVRMSAIPQLVLRS